MLSSISNELDFIRFIRSSSPDEVEELNEKLVKLRRPGEEEKQRQLEMLDNIIAQLEGVLDAEEDQEEPEEANMQPSERKRVGSFREGCIDDVCQEEFGGLPSYLGNLIQLCI